MSNGDSLGSKPTTPCLTRRGAKSTAGYGQKWKDGKLEYVHRLAWEEAHGPIPPGMMVCHRCDNRACRRVDHLFLGTTRDNAIDMARKGRQAFQTRPELAAAGEDHGLHVLTDADVIQIRLSRSSQRRLAAAYGVSQSTIWAARNRKTWRHVP